MFFILDLFWPLSNVFMLVLGIVIAIKGVLKGWRRYVVLAVGLWLPVALGFSFLLGREHAYAYYPGAVYSVLAWTWLGWMIFTSEQEKTYQPAIALQ
jgi:Na+-translocating ferredoxin:NAD+ oxidoreductase RnfE subunit